MLDIWGGRGDELTKRSPELHLLPPFRGLKVKTFKPANRISIQFLPNICVNKVALHRIHTGGKVFVEKR